MEMGEFEFLMMKMGDRKIIYKPEKGLTMPMTDVVRIPGGFLFRSWRDCYASGAVATSFVPVGLLRGGSV